MADRQLLISWLSDAYAMEQGLVPILENHAKDASAYPEISARDEQHAEETRRHAGLVQECLARLGAEPSTIKSAAGRLMGALESVATGAFRDELMKNFIMDYATEHAEIASYKALITAARDLGEENVARTCEQILREEEAMAHWLEERLPMVVRESRSYS